jgi:hypothetical protein
MMTAQQLLFNALLFLEKMANREKLIVLGCTVFHADIE